MAIWHFLQDAYTAREEEKAPAKGCSKGVSKVLVHCVEKLNREDISAT